MKKDPGSIRSLQLRSLIAFGQRTKGGNSFCFPQLLQIIELFYSCLKMKHTSYGYRHVIMGFRKVSGLIKDFLSHNYVICLQF